jgi:hypothetical protein
MPLCPRTSCSMLSSQTSPSPTQNPRSKSCVSPPIASSFGLPKINQPYVPDFWDSTTLEKQTPSVEEKLPKVLVVSGASTHADNGPLHNLESVSEDGIIAAETTPEQSKPASTEPGLFEDMTQDLGIPPPKELKQSLWKLFS